MTFQNDTNLLNFIKQRLYVAAVCDILIMNLVIPTRLCAHYCRIKNYDKYKSINKLKYESKKDQCYNR